MSTINYNGKRYPLDVVESYYDIDLIRDSDISDCATPQEFFEEYIKICPSFTELFVYDIKPIID